MRKVLLEYLIHRTPFQTNEAKDMETIFKAIDYEPINEVREWFGYKRVRTLKDDKDELIRKFGSEKGEELFYKSIISTSLFPTSLNVFDYSKENDYEDEMPF